MLFEETSVIAMGKPKRNFVEGDYDTPVSVSGIPLQSGALRSGFLGQGSPCLYIQYALSS